MRPRRLDRINMKTTRESAPVRAVAALFAILLGVANGIAAEALPGHVRAHRFEVSSLRGSGGWWHINFFPRIGDVDGDGRNEIVYSKGSIQQIAYKLDGTAIWEYTDHEKRASFPRADSLMPLWDFDNDQRLEMVCFRYVDGQRCLVMLDAATGKSKHKTPLDPRGGDEHVSIVPAQLDGPGKPYSVILHADYSYVMALTHDLKVRWKVAVKGLGHTTNVADIDGDGKDELFTGLHLLNAEGKFLFSKPELLQGTGEDHPDSNHIVDLNGDGTYELLSAPGMRVLRTDGSILWSAMETKKMPMTEVQSLRLLRGPKDVWFCATDLHKGSGMAAFNYIFDGSGNLMDSLPKAMHVPLSGDWDGDGYDELFCYRHGGRFFDIYDRKGKLVDSIPIEHRRAGGAYVSDCVIMRVLPNANGAQLIAHEWHRDESQPNKMRSVCVIYENTKADKKARPFAQLEAARHTCY
jgi:hypothetical protein